MINQPINIVGYKMCIVEIMARSTSSSEYVKTHKL
jgi:hypothetical protein